MNCDKRSSVEKLSNETNVYFNIEVNYKSRNKYSLQHRAPNVCTVFNKPSSAWKNMRSFFYDLAEYDSTYKSVEAMAFSTISKRLIKEDIFVLINGVYKRNKLKLWNR